MRRPHAGEMLGLGFDHRSEIIAAIGALLLQIEADRGQVFIADGLGEHHPIAFGAEHVLDRVEGQ